MTTTKHVLVGLLAGMSAFVGGALLWSFTEPYFLNEEEQVAAIRDLPPAWEGQRFAVMADWQVGMWGANVLTIRRTVDRLIEKRPAFVLIAGDFVYHTATGDAEEVEEAARLVRPLTEAGIPVYAVLGNHDYGTQSPHGAVDEELARRLRAALERAGVRVLENEAVALVPPEDSSASSRLSASKKPLYLVGIGPEWPGRAAVKEALAGVPEGAARIVVMHNPNSFAAFPAETAPVAVAGHTHGGQVRLPLTPEWTWMTYFKSDALHTDGWATKSYGEKGNRIYVNRGIGFSLAPLRLNAMPELTCFTLQPD